MTIYLNNFNNWVEKILGGMANAAWLAMIPQTLVLAINRLIVFRSHGHPTISWKLFLFLILLSWLFGLAYFIFYLSPYCGLVYSLDAFAWSYDMSELSPLISTIEYYTSVPILIIAFIVYILVLYVLIAQRKSFTSNNKFLAGHELRLLIQSFLIFFYASFLICCWHYYQYFLPDSPYTVAVINAFWILFSGLNPFLYLTLNKEIRHRFLLLLFCRRVDTKSTLVVTISTARTRESKISTVGTPH
uniref:7TM GPCR serpentine receptor class x (Srx) domain-containing protein n=1 Tax=Acrobeloides nanus TaxID=290746 RepID=A0A914DT81_9BILA